MPEVSIIIPVYNKSVYLRNTLHSVYQQSFSDYEVILVDDGSTDDSLEIAREFAERDARIHILTGANGGVSAARNRGLQAAKGKWIQFLDADDLLLPDYLSSAVPLAERGQADILFSGFAKVDSEGRTVEEQSVPHAGTADPEQLCTLFIQHQYTTGFFGYISNKLFQRKLLEETGAVFPVGITLAEDLDFYVQLYCGVRKAIFWPGQSFQYLQTDSNYLYNTDINYKDQLKIQLDVRKWFMDIGMYEKHRWTLDEKISQYMYYMLFDANEKKSDLGHLYDTLTQDRQLLCCARQAHKGSLFYKMILRAVALRQKWLLLLLFRMRNLLRRGYRMCVQR
ncbi:glycosyltransferase family 2 protein [Flavonifractor hominis]|uniref:Glycosyltransferase family 2 protein n=1 Tax=Flavonifractor hominis TaxID=3133178 RepID=A0ABV1EML0_9FIRM